MEIQNGGFLYQLYRNSCKYDGQYKKELKILGRNYQNVSSLKWYAHQEDIKLPDSPTSPVLLPWRDSKAAFYIFLRCVSPYWS